MAKKVDVNVQRHSGLFLFIPNTKKAKDWIKENLPSDVMIFGYGVVVEHRYAGDIATGMQKDGLLLK